MQAAFQDGRSIRKALDWLIPYATGEKKWPYAQIEPYQSSDLVPALLRAAAQYRDGNYLARVKAGDPGDVPTTLLRMAAEK